jgi:hypothetical protein
MGRVQTLLASRRAVGWVVGVAVLLTLPTLTLGFMIDDFSHRLMLDRKVVFPGGQRAIWDLFRFQDSDRGTFHELMTSGIAPWWTVPDFRLAFFRPLTSLLHAVDYTLFGKLPVLMHVENVALFATIVFIVAALYRRTIGATWVAGLAALMFAVDDAHALVVAWIANRNALLAGAFGFGALLAHTKSRAAGGRRWPIAAPVLFGLALLSGEASVAALVYILSYALWLDEAPRRERAASLVPYACIAFAWIVTYRLIGYGAEGGGFYVDPLREPVSFALAVLERAPVLLLAEFAFPPADLWLAIPPSQILGASIVVAVLVIAGGTIVWRVVGQDRRARFFATGMLLSVVPLCATWPNDRLLLMVGFGAFGLTALFLAKVRDVVGRFRIAVVPVAVTFVVAHLVVAPLLLPLREVQIGALFKRPIERGAATFPLDDLSDRKTYVIVNAPNALVPVFSVIKRVVETGAKAPERARLLGVTVVGSLEIERVDDRTLALAFSEGFPNEPLSRIFRGPKSPFVPGQRIDVEGLEVRIASCDRRGNATRVLYRFDVPLEDPKLVWIVWEETGFVTYRPPPLGGREMRAPIALMGESKIE